MNEGYGMRLFTLLGFQDVILYLIPGLVFVIILGVALGYTHFRSADSEARRKEIHSRFAEEISDRRAPFPLVLVLIIVGTVLWVVGYILAVGWLGVKI